MSLKHFTDNFNLITCSKNDSIFDVAKLMASENIGTVVVKERERPVGIVTDRDLVVRVFGNGNDVRDARVEDVMSEPVATVSEEGTLLDLVEAMNENKVRRICITDHEGRPTGLVSMADVFELLAYEVAQLSAALGKKSHKLFNRAEVVDPQEAAS